MDRASAAAEGEIRDKVREGVALLVGALGQEKQSDLSPEVAGYGELEVALTHCDWIEPTAYVDNSGVAARDACAAPRSVSRTRDRKHCRICRD